MDSKEYILVIAYDRVGRLMAGPAIRSLALARQLSGISDIHVIYEGDVPDDPAYSNLTFIPAGSNPDLSTCKLVLAPPLVALTNPEIFETEIPLVVDLFDPVIFENLELYRDKPSPERQFQHERHLAALLSGFFRGDYFLAAGERQSHLFTGALMAMNRINPGTWAPGSGPEQMVGLVPFGIDPVPDPVPEIPEQYAPLSGGKMIVWGGGMWDWLRPDIVVSAMPAVLKKFPDAHLVFPGTRHPNPHVPAMKNVKLCADLAKKLGIEKHVSFGSWLDRTEYLGLLAHADVGVCAHSGGLESAYAVRTRFMDSIRMGLPQVVSGDDEYSRYMNEYGVGKIVDSSDPEIFARTVCDVLSAGKDVFFAGFEAARSDLSWEKVAEPLVKFAKNPRLTHGHGVEFFSGTIGVVSPRSKPSDLKSLIHRLKDKLSGT